VAVSEGIETPQCTGGGILLLIAALNWWSCRIYRGSGNMRRGLYDDEMELERVNSRPEASLYRFFADLINGRGSIATLADVLRRPGVLGHRLRNSHRKIICCRPTARDATDRVASPCTRVLAPYGASIGRDRDGCCSKPSPVVS